MFQALRKVGDELVMTVPNAFIEQNRLAEGSQVQLRLLGKMMIVGARTRPRYKLADLIAEMQEGLPLLDGWDEMPSVGLENNQYPINRGSTPAPRRAVSLKEFLLGNTPALMMRAPRLDPSKPVVYLDYDGVLHSDDVYWYRKRGIVVKGDNKLFAAAKILESILAPHPEIQVVLSTSWVRVLNYHKAAKRLPPDLRNRLRGATWHSSMDLAWWNSLTRYEQIANHVRRHAVACWLAIDNDADGWPLAESHHLVRTDDSVGLLDGEAQRDLERKLVLLCSGQL